MSQHRDLHAHSTIALRRPVPHRPLSRSRGRDRVGECGRRRLQLPPPHPSPASGGGSRPSPRHELRPTSQRAVSMAELAIKTETQSNAVSRKAAIYGGRLLLAAAIILFWEYEARTLGPLFFAPPLDVLDRIITLAISGKM